MGAWVDKKWWTLVAVCLGTFMLLLDITIVNVALPQIQSHLHASFSDLQWVVDAYALTLASLQLTSGSLADLFGRRRIFVAGVTLFTAGSLLCGFAGGPLFLIISRGAQGIGGAAMFATALALLAHAFRGPERGIAFGAWGAVTGIAVAVGPVLGGLITDALSWRWIFFVNAPIGVAAVIVAVLRVEESRERSARRPDWPGFALFSLALVALVYALIRANERSWTDSGVLICFGLSVAMMVAFLIVEHSSRHPMFDLSLFRVPTFTGGLIAAFAISSSIFALLLYIVLYLQDILGYSALGTGVRMIIISGGVLCTSALAGRLTAHVPIRALIAPGLAIVGVGLLLMRGLDATSSWTALIPGFVVAGLGTGIVNPPLASTAVGVVEPRRAGMASGVNNTFRQVGIATGIAALGSILALRERTVLVDRLARLPGLAPRAASIAAALRNGSIAQVVRATRPEERAPLVLALRSSYTEPLKLVLLIGAAIAFAGAAASLVLIRNRDLASGSQADASSPGAKVADEALVS